MLLLEKIKRFVCEDRTASPTVKLMLRQSISTFFDRLCLCIVFFLVSEFGTLLHITLSISNCAANILTFWLLQLETHNTFTTNVFGGRFFAFRGLIIQFLRSNAVVSWISLQWKSICFLFEIDAQMLNYVTSARNVS